MTRTPQEEIANSLSRGSRNIGAIVYWTGLTDVKIARPLWRQGLHVAGIADAVGKDPGPDAMLNQATKMASRKQGRGVNRARFELKSKGQFATYLVKMPRDLPDRRQDIEEVTISVDCYAVAPQLIVHNLPGIPTDEHRDSVIGEVVEWYTEIQQYVFTEEVSDALVEAMKFLNALSLRTGVYFVSAADVDRVRAVQKFIEASTTARFTVWNIKGDDENAQEARHDTRTALTARLDEVIAKVQKFTEEITVEDATPRSVNARVKLFRELDAQVELYADILGDYAVQLNEKIAKARETLLGSYLAIDDATEAEPTTAVA